MTGGLVPDRTYLVEVSPAVAQARRESADGVATPDRMEAATADFYRRVAAAYAALAEEEPDRFLRLDGEQSIEALHAQIKADLKALTAQRAGTAHPSSGSPDA